LQLPDQCRREAWSSPTGASSLTESGSKLPHSNEAVSGSAELAEADDDQEEAGERLRAVTQVGRSELLSGPGAQPEGQEADGGGTERRGHHVQVQQPGAEADADVV